MPSILTTLWQLALVKPLSWPALKVSILLSIASDAAWGRNGMHFKVSLLNVGHVGYD
jgi:hypothetical protein